MPYLGIFGLEFENNNVIFGISALEFVLLQNFAKKQKLRNLGTKILYSLKKLLLYLKSALSNLSICKI